MFNANMLRGEIARAGKTQKEIAHSIGVSENTFSKKMKLGSFGLDEANLMIELLDIQNPNAIFFGKE